MDGQKCENCRYSSLRSGPTTSGKTLKCRRLPPQLYEGERYGMTDFPDVFNGDWCGEYQPADPETVSEGAATLARMVLLGDMTAARALADKLKGDD